VAGGASVVLLDRSAEALRGIDAGLRARIGVLRGDAAALPFRGEVFDAVVLRAALHHLAEPAAALRQAARVTRPGGAVVVLDKAAPEEPAACALRNAVERLRHPGHRWSWTERELRHLAESARLAVEACVVWVEPRDAEEWIARGDCPAPWDARVREYLEADLAAGGRALGTRRGPRGELRIEERWAALRLRKPGGTR
jgi:SAM-dependent methyltransferase